MKILISGATGLVGCALVEHLFAQGYTLHCLQRLKDNPGMMWDIERLYAGQTTAPFDTIIHLAGENVASGRWTKQRKEAIFNSRVNGTRQLVSFLATQDEHLRPSTLICASAIGYYGNCGERLLTESSSPGFGFLAHVCKNWEAQAAKAAEFGMRVVHLRFGMILSPKGGALHKMLPAFKLGVGGMLASGKQYMSWISIRDLCSIVSFIADNPTLKGAVNVVTPKAIQNKDFTQILGQVVNKLTFLAVPSFVLRLVFGEMADEMLLPSARVSPDKLLQAGYDFQDTDLKQTLQWCIEES